MILVTVLALLHPSPAWATDRTQRDPGSRSQAVVSPSGAGDQAGAGEGGC